MFHKIFYVYSTWKLFVSSLLDQRISLVHSCLTSFFLFEGYILSSFVTFQQLSWLFDIRIFNSFSSSSLTCITQKLYRGSKYYAYQMAAVLLGIFRFWCGEVYEL